MNVDLEAMSPYQHGEVSGTDNWAETDLNLDHYKRFTGIFAHQSDNIITGQIYTAAKEHSRLV